MNLFANARVESYAAFGLNIISEIELPELYRPKGRVPLLGTVVIALSDLARMWEQSGSSNPHFHIQPERVLFHVPDIGIFCIERGNMIRVSPFNEAEPDRLRLYILGTCMGIILLQRRILPLHGSAVAKNGRAYAILGHSGAGKSTLAAAMMRNGYRMLSDDIIPVILEGDTPVAVPAYPQQKLWQNSLDRLGMHKADYRPIYNRENKFTVPVGTGFHPGPLPLAGVFELIKTDAELSITPVHGLERFPILLKHTYRHFLIVGMELMEWHLDMLAAIANKLDFYRVKRDSASFNAPYLVSLLLQAIKQEDPIHASDTFDR